MAIYYVYIEVWKKLLVVAYSSFNMNIMSALLTISVIYVVLWTRVASGVLDEGYKRFDGQKVYRAIATTEEQLNVLRIIEEQTIDGVSLFHNCDIEGLLWLKDLMHVINYVQRFCSGPKWAHWMFLLT